MSTEPTLAIRADREQVVGTVVAAFANDPAFRYFFADESTFEREATAFAAYLFDLRVDHGTVWVVDGGAAVSMWDPPGNGRGSATGKLDVSADALRRLDEYDAEVHGTLPDTPHWYLGILATHPASAGRGRGRVAMRAGLDEAARAGLPAYLETTNPVNVELYRRAGWEVTDSLTARGLAVWVMRYDAEPRTLRR